MPAPSYQLSDSHLYRSCTQLLWLAAPQSRLPVCSQPANTINSICCWDRVPQAGMLSATLKCMRSMPGCTCVTALLLALGHRQVCSHFSQVTGYILFRHDLVVLQACNACKLFYWQFCNSLLLCKTYYYLFSCFCFASMLRDHTGPAGNKYCREHPRNTTRQH